MLPTLLATIATSRACPAQPEEVHHPPHLTRATSWFDPDDEVLRIEVEAGPSESDLVSIDLTLVVGREDRSWTRAAPHHFAPHEVTVLEVPLSDWLPADWASQTRTVIVSGVLSSSWRGRENGTAFDPRVLTEEQTPPFFSGPVPGLVDTSNVEDGNEGR
ncbi:MAG: hypothetical protein H6737_28720 [Alphaproteobacteria bacterium]|nr:hypothetical protein [Alphaproteobacteria bacterium]